MTSDERTGGEGQAPTAPDFKRSFDRLYLSWAVSDIRNSDFSCGLDRLPYNSVLYLDIIHSSPGITPSELARKLGVTKATVTVTVNRLVSKGLVVRDRSEEDGRVRNLRVSDAISKAYELDDRDMSEISRTMSEMYTPEELAKFCEMIDRVSDLIEGSGAARIEDDD